MSDIKLFRVTPNVAEELPARSSQVEKSLQKIFEDNLERILGVRFIASEHSTGPIHGGRIDTLGLDEDGCPVIVEYKRALNENVINQGLFYLDWLMDHRKEFQWLVLEKLGSDVAKKVDWSSPRLLCIAGDFTKYDEHAVKQINRSIELLRYRHFGDELLMVELVHVTQGSRSKSPVGATPKLDVEAVAVEDRYASQRIAHRISQADKDLRDIYEAVVAFLEGLGDDVQSKELKNYVAFKRIKNFACVEVYPHVRVVTTYLKLDPDTVPLEPGFTRDVRKIGHFGTGDLEVSLRSLEDFARAQNLFTRAYAGA